MRYIGIDPDVKESGFAVWDSDKNKLEHIDQFDFFSLLSRIETLQKLERVVVVVEAGWLIKKSNFHGRKGQTKAAGEKIAKAVGANHQVGKLFIEWCEKNGVECIKVNPQGKVDAEKFKRLTGWKKRTNSEKRDAAMLVFGI